MDLPQNTFKHAIAAGRQQIGLWCSLASNYSVEVVAGSGFGVAAGTAAGLAGLQMLGVDVIPSQRRTASALFCASPPTFTSPARAGTAFQAICSYLFGPLQPLKYVIPTIALRNTRHGRAQGRVHEATPPKWLTPKFRNPLLKVLR